MRILFLSGHYPPHTSGGGEISTHYIARGLREQGVYVDVLAEGEEKTYELDGVQVATFPLGLTDKPLLEKRRSRSMARKIEEILSQRDPYDVIHAHDFRSALVLAELQTKAKKVVTIRDYAAISGDTNNFLSNKTTPDNPFSVRSIIHSHRIAEVSFPKNIGRMLQYLLNVKYRQDAFSELLYRIYISKAQQEIIEEHLDEAKKSIVIYNPVQPEFLSTPTQPGKLFHVLYLGRIEMYKGVDVLLHAWSEVLKTCPQARLQLVGEGANMQEFKTLAEKLQIQNSIEFSGRVAWDLLQKIYDNAAVIVSPHRWIEPFGRTVVEAMARRRVVVAANTGGPSEVIIDKKTGLLFKSGSSEELSKILIQALLLSSEDKERITSNAQSWAKEHLSIENISAQYQNFYLDKI